MIQKIAQLDKKQRWVFTGIVLVVAAAICYLLITHGSVSHLRRARSAEGAMELKQQGLVLVEAELRSTQKALEKIRGKMASQQEVCCTVDQADMFFEQITTWATEHRLTPISRVISSPSLIAEDPNTTTLVKQSADVVVQGPVQDLITFLGTLIERPQKVAITNLRVALPPGEDFVPRASFRVILVIDPSSEGKVS
ncbi:hypothetical protein ACFL6U_10625 [Planctomycetota bacterium]